MHEDDFENYALKLAQEKFHVIILFFFKLVIFSSMSHAAFQVHDLEENM